MKKIILLNFLVFLILSCDNNEIDEYANKKIITIENSIIESETIVTTRANNAVIKTEMIIHTIKNDNIYYINKYSIDIDNNNINNIISLDSETNQLLYENIKNKGFTFYAYINNKSLVIDQSELKYYNSSDYIEGYCDFDEIKKTLIPHLSHKNIKVDINFSYFDHTISTQKINTFLSEITPEIYTSSNNIIPYKSFVDSKYKHSYYIPFSSLPEKNGEKLISFSIPLIDDSSKKLRCTISNLNLTKGGVYIIINAIYSSDTGVKITLNGDNGNIQIGAMPETTIKQY